MITVKKIGIIGAGQMGVGIAQVAAANDYQIILYDIKKDLCEIAMAKMHSVLEKRILTGKGTEDEMKQIFSRISSTERMEEMADCDMVIEAATENLSVKQEIFCQLSKVCRPDCIFATNTSSISITSIMEKADNPERGAGMHFFFPVTAMKLIEVIYGTRTADEAVEVIRQVAANLGKVSVICKTDTPGFIVNRCLFAFLLEAIHCYEDGVATINDIDIAIRLGLNHPLGPFEMMDLSGLDTFPRVCKSMQSLPATDWSIPSSVMQLIGEGRFGRKSGRGWHQYI